MSELLRQVLVANIYLQPLQFTLTIVGNILNIRILCSRALRSSPCTYYFLAYAVFNIVYTCLLCPTQFLRSFAIDWAEGKVGCKLHFYFLYAIPHLANFMLILASFDRYFSSSKSRHLHLKSSLRTAKFSILIGSILAALYMLPMLLIYHWDPSSKKCLHQSNMLVLIYMGGLLGLYYILNPSLLFLLGFLTIRNIRRQSTRPVPIATSLRARRTEGELARMLILQLSVHLILILPFGIVYAMNFFVPSTRTPMVKGIRFMFVIWQQCDYFVSFFLYVLSGNIYRQELIRIITFNKRRHTHMRPFALDKTDVDRKLPLVITTLHHADGVPL